MAPCLGRKLGGNDGVEVATATSQVEDLNVVSSALEIKCSSASESGRVKSKWQLAWRSRANSRPQDQGGQQLLGRAVLSVASRIPV